MIKAVNEVFSNKDDYLGKKHQNVLDFSSKLAELDNQIAVLKHALRTAT